MRSDLSAAADFRVFLVELAYLASGLGERPRGGVIRLNDLPYAADVRRLLEGRREHAACRLLRATFDEGLDHSQLLQLGLFSLEADMTYAGGEPRWSPWGMERPEGRNRIRALCEALAAFARDAGLTSFFGERAALFSSWKSGYDAELAEQDHVRVLEEYSGVASVAPYRVCLSPFLSYETSHVDVAARAAVTFYPVDQVRGGSPHWAVREKGPVFWHELGHWMLDPLADAHAPLVQGLSEIYPGKTGPCRGSLRMCVIEHTAQALGVRMRLWAGETGKAHGGRPLHPEDLPLIAAVAEGLRAFERDRGRYKTLPDFYPAWLEVFKTARPKPRWWPF